VALGPVVLVVSGDDLESPQALQCGKGLNCKIINAYLFMDFLVKKVFTPNPASGEDRVSHAQLKSMGFAQCSLVVAQPLRQKKDLSHKIRA
jgi:hypothetical protein